MTDTGKSKGSIGVLGALSIGVGGIVGGGFFATFGLTIEGARGGTPVAFLIGGAIALVTAFSYIGLTLRYPGPGGTVGFLRTAFGQGLLPASMVLSGIASAFIFAPSLLLVSDLVRRGNGEGLFGIFQVAGSLGFLAGPIAGGLLVALTGADGRPAYEAIFATVGVAELALALGSVALLRGFALRRQASQPGGLN